VTEREELARIIDPSSWLVLDSYLAEVKRKHPNSGYDPDNFKDRESLAKADQWLSRPSPVDGLKASLDEATSATMMAEMRADKLASEVERLKGVTSVSLLDRLSEAEAENARLRSSIGGLAPLNAKLAKERDEVRAFIRGDLTADLVEQGQRVAENAPWKARAFAAEAEVERLKSDVADLVRAGSDEATENARLREVVAELERQMEHTFPLEWVDVPRKPKFPPTSQET
jgi:hypothetical protein